MGGFGYYRRIDDRVMCFATEHEADEYEREIKKESVADKSTSRILKKDNFIISNWEEKTSV